MLYLTSISLALIVHVLLSIVVLMVLACNETPTAPAPMLGASNYTDAEVLKVLKDWSKSAVSNDDFRQSCWMALNMDEKKYTVTHNPGNPFIYQVTGIGPEYTLGKLSHGILELPQPATWTVHMNSATNLYKYPTLGFSTTSQVTPTSFDPSIRKSGC